MENDDRIFNEDKIYTSDYELKTIFRLDFEEQNIKNNKEFQKWKYELDKKYGKSIRIYKCSKDCIFFYRIINNGFDQYIEKCPKCNKYICCFCSQTIYGPHIFSEFIRNYCCLKRLFFFIFYREKTGIYDCDDCDAVSIILSILRYILFIIPIINSFTLIISIIQNIFCFNYNEFYQMNIFIYSFLILINVGFAISMSIAFLNLTIIYIIILFLISIPFKMIPFKNFILFIGSNFVESR